MARRQVELFAGAALFIFVHGAGGAHLLWQPKEALACVETGHKGVFDARHNLEPCTLALLVGSYRMWRGMWEEVGCVTILNVGPGSDRTGLRSTIVTPSESV